MAEDGTSSLVPLELSGFVPELFPNEPPLRDSLLNVDDNLTSSELSEQLGDKGVLCVLTRDGQQKRNDTKTKN